LSGSGVKYEKAETMCSHHALHFMSFLGRRNNGVLKPTGPPNVPAPTRSLNYTLSYGTEKLKAIIKT
jgi:hypothetical protein